MDLSLLGKRERLGLRFAGYGAFFLGSFLLMTYLLFPFNRWKGTLEELMSRQLDRKVTIGAVGSWGVMGLKLKDVTIEQVEQESAPRLGIYEQAAAKKGIKIAKSKKEARKKSVPLHIDRLGLRLSLLATLTGKSGACFDAKLFDGRVKGCYVDASRSLWGGGRDRPPEDDDPRSSLKVKFRNLDLEEVPHLEAMVGLPFFGVVDGDAAISYVAGLPHTAEGEVELLVEGLRIGEPGGKLDLSKAGGVLQGEITFEPIEVGNLEFEMKGEGGGLVVKKLEAKSRHIQIRGAGDVALRQPMMLSALNIYVMFKFLPAYTDKSSMTKTIFSALDRIPKMRKAKRPDGFFGYLVKGDLRKGPQAVPSRSGPAPSAAPPSPKAAGLPMGLKGKTESRPGKPQGK